MDYRILSIFNDASTMQWSSRNNLILGYSTTETVFAQGYRLCSWIDGKAHSKVWRGSSNINLNIRLNICKYRFSSASSCISQPKAAPFTAVDNAAESARASDWSVDSKQLNYLYEMPTRSAAFIVRIFGETSIYNMHILMCITNLKYVF